MSEVKTNDINASSLKGPDALFKTNPKLEQTGVWLDYGDFRILVARASGSNKRFKTIFEARMKPYRRALANDTMNDAVAERITKEVWAETVVLGWDSPLGNMVMPYKGAPFVFSVENCKVLFEELPDLFTDIREQSSKMSTFQDDVEAASGN